MVIFSKLIDFVRLLINLPIIVGHEWGQGSRTSRTYHSRVSHIPNEKKEMQILSILEKAIQEIFDEINEGAESEKEWEKKYFLNHLGRYNFNFQVLDCQKMKKLLDVGIHPGHMASICKKFGVVVYGLDYCPEKLQNRWKNRWKNEGITVVKCDAEREKFPFDNETFDHVLFTEVIEHLIYSPYHALGEIHRVLKPNGTLLVTTPNDISLWKLAYRIKRTFALKGLSAHVDEVYSKEPYERHHKRYVLDELTYLLKKCGFLILDAGYFEPGTYIKSKQGFFRAVHNAIVSQISMFRTYLYVKAMKK